MAHTHKHDIVDNNLKVFNDPERLAVITNEEFSTLARAAVSQMLKYPHDVESVVDTSIPDYYRNDMELKNFFKNNFKVLDFACGPGLVSIALAPYASEIIGLDIAQMMVNTYNERFKIQGIDPKEVHAELIDQKGSKGNLFVSPKDEYFDAAICSASYHHLPNPTDTTQKIMETLKPGGKLFVFDRVSYNSKRIDEEMRKLGVSRTGGFTKDEIVTKIMPGARFIPFTVLMWFAESMYNRMDLEIAVKSEVRQGETFYLAKVKLFMAVLEKK